MNSIMIVDDNQENLYLLRILLTGNGYEVVEAANGVEALEKAAKSPPHLVISDLLMPAMDGYTLLRHWKSDGRLREIPFVVYTATYTEPKDEQLALSLGADAFIIKPTEPELFMTAIREVIKRRENGLLSPPRPPTESEEAQLKQYNEALIRKLEKRALQLERANLALEEDIRERKRAEDALHRSTSLLQAALDATPDGVLAVDKDGRVVAFNQRFVEMMLIPESLMEKADDGLLLERAVDLVKYPEAFIRKVRALYDEPEKESWDLIEFRDGRTFERFSKPQRMGDKIVGRVWDFRDITERIQHETEREKLQVQLIQAQKMELVGRLAGGVAHDFNNMLGVILGNTEIAMAEVDQTQKVHARLEEIQKAAMRSANLTRQLLAFARKQIVSPKVLDLNDTIEGMLKMIRRLIGEDIDLVWLPDTNLSKVRIDPSQLDQILANLCVNARDAMPGVGKLSIETGNISFDETYCTEHAGFVPGEYVLVAVSDDGAGMDKETLGNIFEPFFTTKETGKGTGLGLSTVYGIVKQNNGFVNVLSEPGRGTTFRIYLPRFKGKTVEPVVKERAKAPEGGSETILLVEDERAILEMTARMLEILGYRVLSAEAPNEVLRIVRDHDGKIDLLITDVVMPEMNGRDLAKQVSTIRPDMKYLFMSGYTANAIAHHGVLDEGVEFLEKPFALNDLAFKVRKIFKG